MSETKLIHSRAIVWHEYPTRKAWFQINGERLRDGTPKGKKALATFTAGQVAKLEDAA